MYKEYRASMVTKLTVHFDAEVIIFVLSGL